jgi:hypothetical protein
MLKIGHLRRNDKAMARRHDTPELRDDEPERAHGKVIKREAKWTQKMQERRHGFVASES